MDEREEGWERAERGRNERREGKVRKREIDS